MTGLSLIVVRILTVVGSITCVCMICDACVGIKRWREVRRKLRELRNAPRAQSPWGPK